MGSARFEIHTNHMGLLLVSIGGPALAIPEHRKLGKSKQSQIAVGKNIKGEPALILQTHDTVLPPQEAALLQAVETRFRNAIKWRQYRIIYLGY